MPKVMVWELRHTQFMKGSSEDRVTWWPMIKLPVTIMFSSTAAAIAWGKNYFQRVT